MTIRILLLILFLSLSCQRGRFADKPSFMAPDIRGQRNTDNVPLDQRCSSLKECASACREIYRSTAEANQCLKFSIRNVEDIYKTAIYLQKPVNRDLQTIRDEEFELFVEISPAPLNEYIENYTISESKRVLAWIAEEPGIARLIFSLGSRHFRQIMLGLLRSADPLVAEEALHRTLSRGDTFYQICNDRNNDHAVYMIHQVIMEDLCQTRLHYVSLDLYELREACVLRVYCHYHAGRYVHANNFRYISRVIEYDDVFDYIQEEDANIGLGFAEQYEINARVCDRVCGFYPGSCE